MPRKAQRRGRGIDKKHSQIRLLEEANKEHQAPAPLPSGKPFTHCIRAWVDGTKNFVPTEIWYSDRPAHSKPLYRISRLPNNNVFIIIVVFSSSSSYFLFSLLTLSKKDKSHSSCTPPSLSILRYFHQGTIPNLPATLESSL